jgi:ligand-binding sensor domain-containing protein
MFRLCLLAYLILSQIDANAQHNIPFLHIPAEYLGVKQGLSQGYISGIIQDRKGFMWFGTNDGLNKYDGYKFTVYRYNPKDTFSLPDNMVSGLAEDENENIWVATRNKGLFLFHKKTERFHSVKLKGLQSNVILSMNYQHGKLLIRSNTNALLYRIKSLKLTDDVANLHKHIQLLFDHNAQQTIQALHMEDTKSNHLSWMQERQLWLSNSDTLIRYQANETYTKWTATGFSYSMLGIWRKKNSYMRVPEILEDNRLHLFENNKLHIVDIKQGQVIQETIVGNSFKEEITHFETGTLANGDLIIRVDSQMYHYDIRSNQFTEWQKELTTSGIKTNNSYSGSDGIRWLCTAGFGVIKSDTRKLHFHNYLVPHNSSILQMPDSHRVDYIPHEIQAGLNLGNLGKDRRGNYWMLSQNGFRCYQSGSKKLIHYPSTLEYPFRFRFVNDQEDKLWMFADYGSDRQYIHRINKEIGMLEKTYKIPVGPINNQLEFVRDIHSTPNGLIYLATEKGLYQLNESATDTNMRWKIFEHHLSDKGSISSNSLWCICADPIDPDNYLWLGTTSTGFDQLNIATGKFKNYSTDDGLPNNVVYGILTDRANNLWMSTNKGLSCFNPVEKTFQNYTTEDGLSCDEFNHFEYMKLKSGELFFGGVGGYTIFKPEEVLQKQNEVPIVLTGLSISNKSIIWQDNEGILDAPITYAKTITLHPGQNMITINFASLEYRSNLKKFYKYRLEGFDSRWTEPGNKNEATYTNLSPGKYTFYVTGTNSDGIWNKIGTSIDIIVLPNWYQTWWFKVSLAILILFGLYSLYRYRLSKQLEVLNVRNRIATDLHDEIGSTLSSIAMYSEAVQKMPPGDEKITMVINRIHANTTEVLESMSDIVWAVNTRNDQLYHLLNRMRDFGAQLSEAKGFRFEMSNNIDLPDFNLDIDQRKNIYLIYKEAMNNAAKYSQCANVWVDIKFDRKCLSVQIKDDGIGFDAALIKSSSGGNGLFNMKKRAADIHAVLFIETGIANGTNIRIDINLT